MRRSCLKDFAEEPDLFGPGSGGLCQSQDRNGHLLPKALTPWGPFCLLKKHCPGRWLKMARQILCEPLKGVKRFPYRTELPSEYGTGDYGQVAGWSLSGQKVTKET